MVLVSFTVIFNLCGEMMMVLKDTLDVGESSVANAVITQEESRTSRLDKVVAKKSLWTPSGSDSPMADSTTAASSSQIPD